MSNLLEVNQVSKSFGNFKALNNASITVPKGSIFGLLGPNGAGKTTLIRII
ncbi:MAG TPA: ATP-binding cassette domain-containing protein, partial [Mariniflexile sp.]|nr:ATP-binding cassette domain-containing protein [Mariniflexile sp.]